MHKLTPGKRIDASTWKMKQWHDFGTPEIHFGFFVLSYLCA